ncbi:hypothetical protein [Natronobacterium gregoryi]|uniref:DUF3168 domain-containing protein n=2 Tax=Natronobacterium gregoryi TaxID=44930 RepID=L0AIP0_NATGS|nr:hypothetical protein [Natronobacterium gregoryi]AFZ73042.1 hypothetical protein Natgr_1857 [Natronobacterium gregoryi SP2]ELY70852.1 hypothetical protein C490_06162 [Natronobacterium gregoryi SP2]PLK20433.1 hypothetical protein CYV19_09910 [Natronobacterium gregoryi SP2]SFI62933.1 hypothetical protein SAMN05443661_102224 [Natronobacterium gregoryi]
MTYGSHEALADVIDDLRNHDDLVDLLEDGSAIDEGWPRKPQDHDIVVRVQPITESSSHMGGGTERVFRFQVSVVATADWRSDQQAPTYQMAKIMHQIAERLDVGAQSPYAEPGEIVSGSWEEVTGNRIALIEDWRVTVRQRR